MLEEKITNPRYPHDIKIYRADFDEDNDDLSEDEDYATEAQKTILYEGKGRSYTDTTTTGDGKVDENKRKISLPVRFDEWEEDKWPLDGDTVEVAMGNVKERGTVKDFEPDNNRSVVYWELLRV